MKKILSVLIICVLFISGCLLCNNQANAKDSHKYTGEELYMGIVFGQGNVAKELPQLWDKETLKQYNNKQNSLFVNKLVKQIKKKDPVYFTEFEQAVYSGNQVKIGKYLNKGTEYFEDYSISKNNKAYMTPYNIGEGSGQCFVLALYAVVAVARYLYVPKKSSSYSFDKEKLVNEIAITFAK